MHVRYEDSTSDPQRPFAFGVTIEQLDAYSTNELWQKVLVEAQAQIVRKEALLRNLSVYWDPLEGPPQKWDDNDRMSLFMRDLIPSAMRPIDQHIYILDPVNATLHLTIDRPRGAGSAKVTAEVDFPSLALGLQDRQYRNVLGVLNMLLTYWNRIQTKYRPGR